jgi:CRP-like cAMP-binding protein
MLAQMVREVENHENNTQFHYLASVQERIWHQLNMLADRFGVIKEDGVHLNLRLTRSELAQLAGTINESLSRHLTELKGQGIIDLQGKEIIIRRA